MQRSDFIAAIAPTGVWERLSSTYYDTPDGRLAAQGLSIRIREEGGSRVQAVKTQGSAVISRSEFECSVDDTQGFPALTGVGAIDDMLSAAAPELAPVALIYVDRWAAEITFRETRIELAIDLGRAQACDDQGHQHAQPLAEVELELIEGDPSRVFDFAKLLIANAPLRFCARTKLQTALCADGSRSGASQAPRTEMNAEASTADLLQESLNILAAQMAELQPRIIDLRPAEDVRQMRVALRRLRSIERVFRRYLKTSEIADLAMQAKYFAKRLGPARDWDVFMAETLPVTKGVESLREGARIIQSNAYKRRAECWADAVETLSSKEFTIFLIHLARAGTLADWRCAMKNDMAKPAAALAPEILDRALRKTRKAATQTRFTGDLTSRHPLRLAIKKLRYPIQLFRYLYPKSDRKPYMSTLSALQNAFGAVNDGVTAQVLADEAAISGNANVQRAAGFIAGYKTAQARSAAESVDELWKDFENLKPFWQK